MADQQQQPQSQASLTDQLRNAIPLLDRAGLYDAADYLRTLNRPPDVQQAQPSLDLEPVRRLIQTIENSSWLDDVDGAASEALPTLRFLLASHKQLINLLCRAHRDGGQYINEHGIDKAVEDADLRIAEAYAEQDFLLAEVEELREENARLTDVSISIREDNKRLRSGLYHGVRVEVIQGLKLLQLVDTQTDGFNLIRAFVAEESTQQKPPSRKQPRRD